MWGRYTLGKAYFKTPEPDSQNNLSEVLLFSMNNFIYCHRPEVSYNWLCT